MNMILLIMLEDAIDLVIIHYILTHTVYALYLRHTGSAKWWLSFIPGGTSLCVHLDLQPLPKWLLVLQTIFGVFMLSVPWPWFLFYRVIIYIRDAFISLTLYEGNKFVWSFIPMYRYVYMLKVLIQEVKSKKCE